MSYSPQRIDKFSKRLHKVQIYSEKAKNTRVSYCIRDSSILREGHKNTTKSSKLLEFYFSRLISNNL